MAWDYLAPLRDMRFVIERVLQAPASWRACAAFADVDGPTAAAILDEAARFAREVLLPLNAVGDREGCRLDAHGQVHTPPGFRAAYRAFVDAGWPALPCDPAWGGQGLPLLVDAAVREMLDACNQAWTMYPDLLHGAYETLAGHAGEALKAQVLPRIASGEWLAAMALTEPQAGSDLGLLRCRASMQPDGSLRVWGEKIFISGAEHDLTDNIVHLVLCRLPDAPPGTQGITLALVPKILPDGGRNALHCDGLEDKLGIHGSATCAVRYEGATGWIVGAPHRGLKAMFVMMNSARLHVGLQGVGQAEIATQNAVRYAMDRVQGGGPIARHPAMRHTLLRLQATTEALRVIAYRAALALDEAAHHPDAGRRAQQGRIATLLTPIVKSLCTSAGFDAASSALQVFGGHGYVRGSGIEQSLRDARIAMIYEGTNEIQAIDLVQRKLVADRGETLHALLQEIDDEARACAQVPSLADMAAALRSQTGAAREALQRLLERDAEGRDATLTVADDAMAGLSHLMLAWAFAASARAAMDEPDRPWARVKIERMRHGMHWIVPQAQVHWQRIHGSVALPMVAAD